MARIRIEDHLGTIYKITNKINGKIYIGQTRRNESERWQQHIKSSKYNYCSDYNTILHQAIRKYGTENFEVQIIEKCDFSLLNSKEIYWIQYYDSQKNGYNITNGGYGCSIYDYNKIYELWLTGKSCFQIIEETGISYTTLGEILNIYNISVKERQNRGFDYKVKIEKDKIKEAFLEGKSINEIHLKYRISAKWIKRVLLDLGFTIEQIKENAQKGHIKSGKPVKINQYDNKKEYIQTFSSIKEAKISLGKKLNNTSLNKVLQHDNNLHYYNNYYWRYAE